MCPKCEANFADVCAECPDGRWGKHLFCPTFGMKVKPDGPGTKLTKLLSRMGFRYTPECKCRDMAIMMDWWGPRVCRERSGEILAVMRASAADPRSNPMRIPFSEWLCTKIILHCCKE
jgi:hypothetical protein